MRRLVPLILLATGLCFGAVYYAAELHRLAGERGFPLDDSWIHLAFAANLASGDGLSLNPGELVTGSTAPLWTALLAVIGLLPGDPVLWSQLVGWALYLVAGWLTYRLGQTFDLPDGLALVAALLVLATDWMIWSALSGLEIPLFVTLTLAGLLLHARERSDPGRAVVSPAVLGIACLARPEGLLLLLLAALDKSLVIERHRSNGWRCALGDWRSALAGLGLAAIVLVPMALFNLLASGSALPTTFGAKVGPAQSNSLGAWLPGLRYLLQAPLAILFRSQPYSVLLAAAGGLALLKRSGGDRDRGLLPALWLVALPLAYGVVSAASGMTIAGNFGRYYFPLFPVLALVGCVGLSDALGLRSSSDGPRRYPVLWAVGALLLLWPTVAGGLRGARHFSQNVANVHESDVKVARWLAVQVPAEAVLAVNDIGAIGYLLPNRLLDLAGIAHPEAQRYRVEAAAAGRSPDTGTLEFLARNRPDYLVIFPQWFPELASGDGVGRDFRLLERFPISNNITMGGDELVVLATPWTRSGSSPGGG